MRVLILHDAVDASARADELDVLEQAAAVEAALAELGHTASRLPFDLDLARAEREIRAAAPDVAFNLVESVARSGRLIHLAPSLLDALHVAYTGCPTEAVFLTSGKLIGKRLLANAGLPTPDAHSLAELRARDRVALGPWILKSVWEHGSVGLDEDSVLETDAAAVLARALEGRRGGLGGEGFAERYVDGREFNLALLDDGRGAPEPLPPAEITFDDYVPGKRRVVGYRAKWDAGSFEYHHTPRRFAFPAADAPLLAELSGLALRCWKLFDLSGYARVDFRVGASGAPFILEINTNPCLAPDAGFAAALGQAGIPFARAIERLLAAALARSRP